MYLYPNDGEEAYFTVVSPFEDWKPYSPVRDLYTTLLHEYHSLYNIPFPYNLDYEAPETAIKVPSIRAVLPEYHGWWWNPYCGRMIRIKEGLRQHKYYPDFLQLSYIISPDDPLDLPEPYKSFCDIARVSWNIINRAQAFVQLNYAEALFAAALLQVEDDVKQAYRDLDDYFNGHGMNRVPPDYYPTDRKARQFDNDLPEHELLLWHVRYQNLRLYWLHLTQVSVQERITSHKKIDRTGVHKFDRLIKPAELHKVSEFIETSQMIGDSELPNPNEFLGWWYASTLYHCGASWQELRAIKNSYATWSALVSKRMSNKSDSDERTSKHISGVKVLKRIRNKK